MTGTELKAAHPGYILVRTEDLEVGPEIVEYLRGVDETLQAYGAEILVQNLPARVLEGAWAGFVTLLRFSDREAAQRWYDSPEYAAIRHLRQDSSTPTCILVEGVAPDHRSADLVEIFGLGSATGSQGRH
jgi:uncharacterized protein (DUF1330 family)